VTVEGNDANAKNEDFPLNGTRRQVLGGAIGAAVALTAVRAGASGMNDSPVVETVSGKVRGLRSGGVDSYKNIPFAGDTGGRNRFRPAPPPTPWTGVRDATQYGPGFPQATPFGAQFAPMAMSEGCAQSQRVDSCGGSRKEAAGAAVDLRRRLRRR